jgi:general secretion pathway protein A
VTERKGFILLTGEVGTGKTTMAHAFLGELDKKIQCIYLSNPLLTPQDLYNYLASSAFKKRVICKSKAAFFLYFEAFLRARLKNREVFILVIDEAQRLSYELLEEIRLLSNMETAEEKLINIFLIGQPELNEKLTDPRCRPLLQRISIRHHIKPLNLDETIEYLSTRLRWRSRRHGKDISQEWLKRFTSTPRDIRESSIIWPIMSCCCPFRRIRGRSARSL